MNAYKNASFIGIVIFFFGVVITGYGFSFLLEKEALDANGVRVKGTVISIEQKAIYRSPVVEFRTLEGKKVTFMSDVDINVDFFDYKVGQEVDVIYDKDKPRKAKIDTFWQRNVAQVYLGCLGLFLMLLGWFLRRFFLKKAKKYA